MPSIFATPLAADTPDADAAAATMLPPATMSIRCHFPLRHYAVMMFDDIRAADIACRCHIAADAAAVDYAAAIITPLLPSPL